MPVKEIFYSETYKDDIYEYRHVILPPEQTQLVPRTHLLTETEWRNLGLQMSAGWVHFMLHNPEPHVLLFRRPLKSSLLPLAVVRQLEAVGIPQDSFIFYQNEQWVYQVGQLVSSNDQLRCERIDSLGPFGICEVDVSLTLTPHMFQYTINKIGKEELSDEEQVTGTHAPIAEITLEGFARSLANIPDNATHFCWLYPPQNILNIDEVQYAGYDEKNLLKIGGFAYFNIDEKHNNKLRLLRVNSLIISARNGLIFEGPFPWPRQLTDQLWSQNRFHPVTLPSLREKGARYFAFINPYEVLSNEIDQSPPIRSENGAFVYLFNVDHSTHPFDCYFAVADNCLGVASSDND